MGWREGLRGGEGRVPMLFCLYNATLNVTKERHGDDVISISLPVHKGKGKIIPVL